MDAILLIIGIAYGVCRIVIKSVQQRTYFLFSVNLILVGVNYGQRTIMSSIKRPYLRGKQTQILRGQQRGNGSAKMISIQFIIFSTSKY
jgi:hypothetical protein